MSRRSICFAALIGLFLTGLCPQAYAAGTSVVLRLRPGLGIPSGDFADANMADAGNGPQLGGSLEIVMNERVAVGIEGGWMRNKHGFEGETLDLGGGVTLRGDEDRFTTTHIGACGRYLIPAGASKVHPNVQVGLGRYSMKEKWMYTLTDPLGATSETGEEKFGSRFGWRLGLGADYDVTQAVGVGLDVGYTSISMDKDTYGSSKAPFLSIAGTLSCKLTKSK